MEKNTASVNENKIKLYHSKNFSCTTFRFYRGNSNHHPPPSPCLLLAFPSGNKNPKSPKPGRVNRGLLSNKGWNRESITRKSIKQLSYCIFQKSYLAKFRDSSHDKKVSVPTLGLNYTEKFMLLLCLSEDMKLVRQIVGIDWPWESLP